MAAVTPSSSKDVPPWLVEIHNELWRKHDLLGKVFRTVDLTETDFIDLQVELEKNDPSRNNPAYTAQDVLGVKSDFLRKKSSPISEFDVSNLVPSVSVTSLDPMEVDDADSSKSDSEDSRLALQFPDCPSYIPADAAELSIASAFPCNIRYMNLTALKLKYLNRVPYLTPIRDEWRTVIDVFNRRKKGIHGSAVFTGSPGIGEDYCAFELVL